MKYTNYQEPLFLSVFALFITTLFSTCSFLYPLNPWDDANVYMTIGNAIPLPYARNGGYAIA